MVYIFSDIKFSLDIDSLSQFFKMTLYPIFFLKQQLLLVLCTHQGFLRFRISFKVSLGVPDSSNIKGWTQDSRNALGFDNTWGCFVRISKILWDCNLTKCYMWKIWRNVWRDDTLAFAELLFGLWMHNAFLKVWTPRTE